MIIQSLTVRNFRCFSESKINFDGRVVVMHGPNGSGKSSLLEAMHYCCYLKSFRTSAHRDMIKGDQDHFFIGLDVVQESLGTLDAITVGYSGAEGKVVTCNQKPVRSYKELVAQLKIITLTADDIELVSGAPESRREFLNYALVLQDEGYWPLLKQYRTILDQRNQLLATGRAFGDEFETWSRSLWEITQQVRAVRIAYVKELEKVINELLERHMSDEGVLQTRLDYNEKGALATDGNFETFWSNYQTSLDQERQWKRTLFGAHLDDFSFIFHNRKARIFASRGQQKLLALLVKVAQLLLLSVHGEQGVLLLDDFMTDFDKRRVEQCFKVLKDLKVQIFVSTPVHFDLFYSSSDLCTIDVAQLF